MENSSNEENSTNTEKEVDSFNSAYTKLLISLEQIIFKLSEENLETSIQEILNLYDTNFPCSFNIVIVHMVYTAFYSQKNVNNFYINFLEIIQSKEEEIDKNNVNIFKIFEKFLYRNTTQEAYYLIFKMLQHNLISPDIIKNNESLYFAYLKPNLNINRMYYTLIVNDFQKNYEELKKNDWELHKKLIEEGVNPNEIATIIRNDDIEKLQEISTQHDFNFNQTIAPSLYERYSFIQYDTTLINYAAFFSSIKCFKYLLMNNSNVNNTGKYAIAGGNIEIIHLCEQNHSSFDGTYETAIKFHRNDIFKYLYENKIVEIDDLENFGKKCISFYNYEIFIYLLEKGMKINDNIINYSAKIGNLYLVKHFLQNHKIPKDLLLNSVQFDNFELTKYVLKQDGIDINAKDIFLLYIIFNLMILYFKFLFGNLFKYLKQHLFVHLEIIT